MFATFNQNMCSDLAQSVLEDGKNVGSSFDSLMNGNYPISPYVGRKIKNQKKINKKSNQKIKRKKNQIESSKKNQKIIKK